MGLDGVQANGSLFVTKQQLTSVSTLMIPTEKNVQTQRFWAEIDEMLTCAGPSTAETGLGDRSAVSVNLIGAVLNVTKKGAELENLLANVLQCKVSAAISETAMGKSTIETYFDWDSFMDATDRMKHELKSKRIGYDDSEQD